MCKYTYLYYLLKQLNLKNKDMKRKRRKHKRKDIYRFFINIFAKFILKII